MSDFTVYKPRNGQILKNSRVMSASDLAVELTQLQATNERLTAERDAMKDIVTACRFADETGYVDGYGFVVGYQQMTEEGDKLLATLKLKQQAKGVDDFTCEAIGSFGRDVRNELISLSAVFIGGLEEQAAAKEKGSE